MKRRSVKIILPLILAWMLIFSLSLPVQAAEKYMEGKSADFQITLDSSGGAQIRETWKCFFGGDTITRYRRHYSLEDPDRMGILVQEVLMDGEPMTLLDQSDENRPEGCAAVIYYEDGCTVEMYLSALDSTHTFEILYYVGNAVQVYEDAAEFYWTLTGDQEAFDIEVITGFIQIPYGTRDMGLYFWGHGPSENGYFDALPDEDGMVHQFELYNEDILSDQAVSVRFAMPRELFPDSTRTNDWEGLPDILSEEHGNADLSGSVGETTALQDYLEEYEYEDDYEYEETSWLEELQYILMDFFYSLFRILKVVTAVASFAPFVFWVIFRNSIDRKVLRKVLPKLYEVHRKKPAQAPRYYRSLPDDLKPAQVNKLMGTYPATEEGQQVLKKGSAFSATVLDLVERGLLQLVQTIDGELTYYVAPEAEAAELTSYERILIELYSAAGACEAPKTTAEIRDYMRSEHSWCHEQHMAFGDQVDADYACLGYNREIPGQKWSKQKQIRFGLIWGVLTMLGLSLGSLVYGHLPLTGIYLGAVSGFINSFFVGKIYEAYHPTFEVLNQEGEDRYALWKAYGEYLRDFTLFDEKEVQEVKIWRKYLVYATALGCSEKVMEDLKLRFPQVYTSLLYDFGPTTEDFRYEDVVNSVASIDHEAGYSIRSSGSGSDWSSSDSGSSDWGGFSDSGGSSDSGSSGSDFD